MPSLTTFQWTAIPIALLLFVVSMIRLIRGRHPRRSSLMAALVSLGAAIAVYRPSLTTELAHALGIGRGADLLIYLVAIGFIVSWFYFYQRHRRLETTLTSIVRKLALDEARAADADTSETRARPVKHPPGDKPS